MMRLVSILPLATLSHSFAVLATTANHPRNNNMIRLASTTAATEKVELHAPVGEDGEGVYTASTKGCFDVIHAATPAVLEAVHSVPIPHPQERAFVVADYGTADGGTSLGLMSQIVQEARAMVGSDLEVSIQYEDQKDNEWKSVFNHALGYKTVTDAYGKELISPAIGEGVFVSACGVGFHSQAYPSNSVDLGMSFTAMHWLSAAPSSLVGKAQMHAGQCENGEAEAERLQASEDWKSILMARSKELRTGGRMIIVNFCKTEDGYYLGNTGEGVSMWDSFQQSWDRLAEEGLIDEEERLGISFPAYYRSSKECVDGVKSVPGLRVVDCVERIVACPYRQAWNDGARSAREHAEWYVPTTRTWSESTFKAALKPHQNKKEVMEKFWSNYADIVEKDPSAHGMDYVHTYLVVEKE